MTHSGKTALQQYYNRQDMETTKKSIKIRMDQEELARVQMEYEPWKKHETKQFEEP